MSLVTQEFLGSFVDQILGSAGLVAAGIHAGDPFSGTFSYHSGASPISTTSTDATYPAHSFTVTLPNGMELGANELSIRVSKDPQDPSIEVFGKLPHNTFMGLLLRGPAGAAGPVSSTSLPTNIVLSNFIHKDLTLCDVLTPLFSFSRTPLPPGGSTIFLRGHLTTLQRVSRLSLALGLLSAKYCAFRRQPT
jgi:hypothetical protein